MSAIERNVWWIAIGVTLVALGSACKEAAETPPPAPQQSDRPSAEPPPPAPQPPAVEPPLARVPVTSDPEAGGAGYQVYCATCHGPEGDGDGPLAASLDPKPARHSDGTYMNPLTDDYLFKIIKFGGPAVGKSPLMAPMDGTLSDQQIRNVIAFLRSLTDPPDGT